MQTGNHRDCVAAVSSHGQSVVGGATRVSAAMIAGIVIAAVLLIVIVVVVLCCYR